MSSWHAIFTSVITLYFAALTGLATEPTTDENLSSPTLQKAIRQLNPDYAQTTTNTSFDTHHREQWTTSRILGPPDPADLYDVEVAFRHLRFEEPLAITWIPGSNRFCVATRSGKLFTFENRPDVIQADLLIDLQRTIYGIAFHPEFANNGYFYVTNFENPSWEQPDGAHLSRFQVTATNSWQATHESEQLILTWPSGGHNGGCIRFGPDGMLYVSVGDSSGIADELETGQDISDLSASILRIDVDHPSPGEDRVYSIPSDNPFVDLPEARAEIWSFGHRHVWKFSFDRSGTLWAGDVGQDLWEGLYQIKRGGNYGWSIREANHPFRPNRTQGPGPIQEPVAEHDHSYFRSITAGFVNYSNRLSELQNCFIYGDYDTGSIWALPGQSTSQAEQSASNPKPWRLADTQLRLVAFGQDPQGEIFALDFVGGQLHRLVKRTQIQEAQVAFPKRLSETGLFASTSKHIPAKGVIPYSVNAPLWSDNAVKDRFMAVPRNATIEMDAVFYPHQPDYPDLGWQFPDGTVLVKTFSVPMNPEHPDELTRLETRVMHYQQMPGNDDEYGAQLWHGYTYVWNDEQTDAFLLDAEGLDRTIQVVDSSAPGGVRTQKWHFPSRSECMLCHTMGAKYALGTTTLQLNKLHDYGNGQIENQLQVYERLGLFKDPLPAPPEQLPALVDYRSEDYPLHLRARAYLHVNCAHCHRKWGGGNTDWESQASLPLTHTGMVNAHAGQGDLGIPGARILVPGKPEMSLILQRMKLQREGKMPHVGSTVHDHHGIELLEAWIGQLDSPTKLSEPGALRPRLPHKPAWYERAWAGIDKGLLFLLGCAGLFLWWWNHGPTLSDHPPKTF